MPSDVVRSKTRVIGAPLKPPKPDALTLFFTCHGTVDAGVESGLGAFAAAVATVECFGALRQPRPVPTGGSRQPWRDVGRPPTAGAACSRRRSCGAPLRRPSPAQLHDR